MRALVLLSLGVCLVWLVAQNASGPGAAAAAGEGAGYGAPYAASADAPPAADGLAAAESSAAELSDSEARAGDASRGAPPSLAAAERPAGDEPVARLLDRRTLSSTVERGAPASPQGSAARASTPTQEGGAPPAAPDLDRARQVLASGRGATRGEALRPGPVELASEVLHRPDELATYLQREGAHFSAARKNLALSYACAVLDLRPEARDFAAGLERADDVSRAELDLLAQLLDGGAAATVHASSSATTPLMLAARLGRLETQAATWLAEGQYAAAARGFSQLLLHGVQAPWPAEREALQRWTDALANAQRRHRWNRKGEWPSVDVEVRSGDSLVVLRKRVLEQHPEMLVCTGLIERANEIVGRVIHPGDVLRVPTDTPRMFVDLEAHWAFYLHGDEVVAAWEVGIGKEGHETPTGTFTVGKKNVDPAWFPRGQTPLPFGHPENPLGTRWIEWVDPAGAIESIGFHGTNDPDGVGGNVSRGCLRMRNEDVEELFEILPRGARIDVVP